MNMRIAGLITMVLWGIVCVFGQDTLEVQEPRDWISGAVSITASYDDNILDYSPADIQRFENGLDPRKFSINRTSDVITAIRLRLDMYPRLIHDAQTMVRMRYATSLYAENPIRTWYTWAVELRQELLKKYYVRLGFNALPSIYLRNLYCKRPRIQPPMSPDYVQAYIEKKEYSIEVTGRVLPRLNLAVQYEFGRATYNPEFRERDNSSHSFTVGGDLRLSRILRGSVDYRYSFLWAEGRDAFTDPVFDSLADISSRSHRFVVGARVDLNSLVRSRLVVSTRVTYEYQKYISEKVGDTYHFGRRDHFLRLSAEASYPVWRVLQFSVQYYWERNRTNLPETDDPAGYQTHKIGMQLRYTF